MWRAHFLKIGRFWLELGGLLVLSAFLLAAAWWEWLPLDLTEALGFVTGALCVWLVIRGNIWTWPIGIANNVFFALLFWKARLFADMGLQAVYFVLAIWGWWNWLYGGKNEGVLQVNRTPKWEWLPLGLFVLLGTWGLHDILLMVNGAAPFWDSLTTILCLAAQYLLCRKRVENWFFWIAADVIYVPLYFHRGLPLIAVLYGGFLLLCLVGLRRWRADMSLRRW